MQQVPNASSRLALAVRAVIDVRSTASLPPPVATRALALDRMRSHPVCCGLTSARVRCFLVRSAALPTEVGARLDSCCAEENWDFEGSKAVTEATVAFARVAVAALYADDRLRPVLLAEAPVFNPEPSGCVMVEWHRFCFSVTPEGVCSVWFPDDAGEFSVPADMRAWRGASSRCRVSLCGGLS